MDDNRRGFLRFPLILSIEFSIINKKSQLLGPYSGKVVNLSGGGMLFTTHCPLLRHGTLIIVRFETEKETDLQGDFLARVIRSTEQELKQGNHLPHYLAAVEFKFIKESRRSAILSYVNCRTLKRRKSMPAPNLSLKKKV